MYSDYISLTGFIISLFVLYRLLVRNYEKQIDILKNELEYKQNYRYKLEEYKAFYEEDISILKRKLNDQGEKKEELEKAIERAESRIKEINVVLSSESTKRVRLESIAEHARQAFTRRIYDLKKDNINLLDQLNELQNEYRSLVEYIKEKHGDNCLMDFLYGDNTYAQLKLRRQKQNKRKFGIS
jgi:predicted  nucleic acid-binding Zn-ribbon protein